MQEDCAFPVLNATKAIPRRRILLRCCVRAASGQAAVRFMSSMGEGGDARQANGGELRRLNTPLTVEGRRTSTGPKARFAPVVERGPALCITATSEIMPLCVK